MGASLNPNPSVATNGPSKGGGIKRAIGWLLILTSPVFLLPIASVIGSRPAHFGLGSLLVMLCFPALTAAFLCLGSGLVTGRKKLSKVGGFLFAGAVATYLVMTVLYLTRGP